MSLEPVRWGGWSSRRTVNLPGADLDQLASLIGSLEPGTD